jgi:hypothetical protein
LLRSKNFSVLLILSLVLFPDVTPADNDESLREQGRKALDAYRAGLYEQSLAHWQDLYLRSTIGTEMSKVARSFIYMSAYRVAEGAGENCGEALKWVAKGKSPGPPDYSSPGDINYALLLAIEGTCSFLQGRYEESNTQLTTAKNELIRSGQREAAEPIAEVSKLILAVGGKILREGSYITNKGVIQLWIAKVQRRRGDTLDALVTYGNSELGSEFAKGDLVQLLVGDCKELGAISADAALKGWKE